MTQSQRKLAGAVLLPVSVIAWAVLGTWLYLAFLTSAPWWVHLPYFIVAGMGWMLPAMVLVRWMARPDP
jgi:hypothetical protein